VTRRLFHINAHNDLEALDEVFTLMNDIRQAWNTLPTLMADTAPSVRYAN
jgi:flagellar protein FliS